MVRRNSCNLELFKEKFKDELDVADTLIIHRGEGLLSIDGLKIKASWTKSYDEVLDKIGTNITEISVIDGVVEVVYFNGKVFSKGINDLREVVAV